MEGRDGCVEATKSAVGIGPRKRGINPWAADKIGTVTEPRENTVFMAETLCCGRVDVSATRNGRPVIDR
jgi:hypothetical protein